MPTQKINQTFEKVDVEVRIRARLKALRDEMEKFQKDQQALIDTKQTEFNRVQKELNDMLTLANQTMAGFIQAQKELEEILK